jgi:hypothetical protein
MAKPKVTKPTAGARSFKKTGEGFTPIQVGEEIRGKFVRMRHVTITDTKTHERKTINAYDLKLEDGSTASISGRALLDDAFNDVFDAIPQDKLAGQEISIIRGEDVETPTEGNMMGTYEVLVWDTSTF